MSRWLPLGPSCVPDTEAGDADDGDPRRRTVVAGRVRVLAVDPRAAARTVFAGTDFGGLWRTLDGGQTWEPTADAGISIVDLAVTPSGQLWVASALRPGASQVARSEDAGTSWSSSSFLDGTLTVMLPDPRNDRLVFVGTSGGDGNRAALLHGPHTQSGGDLFVKVRDGRCTSLGAELDATTGKLRLYAAFDGDWIFAGDPDVGLVALPKPAGVNDIIRTKLVVAPSDPSVVYVAVGISTDVQVLQGLFRSANRGGAWARIGPIGGGTSTRMGTQIHHNLTLAVHPRDPDVVMLGEVHLWRSADGGQSFDDVGNSLPPIHVDQMSLAFDPAAGAGVTDRPGQQGILWASNDGGVFLSTDGGRTFHHRNRGLQTAMVYQLAHHPVVPAVMLAGTQDNGALRATGDAGWRETAGGDVTTVAIDQVLHPEPGSPADPPPDLARYRKWYSASFATLEHSLYAGELDGSPLVPRNTTSWEFVIGESGEGDHTPILPDRLDPKVVYWGHRDVVQVNDDPDFARDLDDEGHARRARKTIIFTPTDGLVTALTMSRDGRVMYVGTAGGGSVARLVRTGELWSDQTPPVPTGAIRLPGGSISSIAIDPGDSDRVFISYQAVSLSSPPLNRQLIWHTNNGGAEWLPIELDPQLEVPDGRELRTNAVRSMAIDPVAPHSLYVACDSGIFRFDPTSTTGTPWSTWWKGLPRVSVRHIAIHERARLLRAATHGRGVWERPLTSSDSDGEPPAPVAHVYLRAHRYDDGRRAPLNESGEDPIDSRRRYGPLDGADIKIDIDPVLSGSFQKPSSTVDYTPDGPIDHLGFRALANRTPRRSREARVYIQVQNAGPDIADHVKVRVFWSELGTEGFAPRTAALWAAFAADNEPADGDWHAVAPPQAISKLRPAEPQVARFTWEVPRGPDRVALLAVVGTPAARTEPIGAPDLLLRVHEHISLKPVSLDEPLYLLVGLILVGAGLAAGITYALVKDPP